MGSILESLMTFGIQKRVVDKAKKKMDNGETWIYPVQLKKGDNYQLVAACSGAKTSVRFALLNGRDQTPLGESDIGKKVSLQVSPEEDGMYRMVIVLTSAGRDFTPAKVTADVLKQYIPSRVLARAPEWV